MNFAVAADETPIVPPSLITKSSLKVTIPVDARVITSATEALPIVPPSFMSKSSGNVVTFVDESEIITVPDAFGNVIVRSAVGSTTVSVVSFPSSVAPSKIIVPSSKTFKVTRQGEFYALTNLTPFLKKVKSSFGAKFADDRWNPADVWFYKDEAVRQIKDIITHSSVMDSSYMNALPRSKQKASAIYDIKQMNELLLVLYEKNILIPVSLKKATGSGAVFTSRIGINNGRKDKDNQPKDPVVTKKQYPITADGNDYIVGGKRSDGGRNLKYDLKTQVATIDSNGKQIIKTEYDYVNPGTSNNIVVQSSGEFGAAGGYTHLKHDK